MSVIREIELPIQSVAECLVCLVAYDVDFFFHSYCYCCCCNIQKQTYLKATNNTIIASLLVLLLCCTLVYLAHTSVVVSLFFFLSFVFSFNSQSHLLACCRFKYLEYQKKKITHITFHIIWRNSTQLIL